MSGGQSYEAFSGKEREAKAKIKVDDCSFRDRHVLGHGVLECQRGKEAG